jgi:hypothetical protein
MNGGDTMSAGLKLPRPHGLAPLHEKEKLMSSAPFGTIRPSSGTIGSPENEGAAQAAPSKTSAPRPAVRIGKRAEDTGAGCRANAAADLARAHAPGGDYMRERLEQSAAVWAERASLLERLEGKFKQRTLTA